MEVEEYLSVDDRSNLLAFISVDVDASERRKINQINLKLSRREEKRERIEKKKTRERKEQYRNPE